MTEFTVKEVTVFRVATFLNEVLPQIQFLQNRVSCLSLRTSHKKLILRTNYPNAHSDTLHNC